MLKKLILASSILAVCGVAVASPANPAPYVGAGLGLTNNYANVHGNSVGTYRGVPFKLLAGYGGLVDPSVYLAGEISATPGTVNISNNHGLKTSYGFGASVIPGLMLTDHTMAFARAGVVDARFTQAKKTRVGGEFGLGMQTSLTQCVDVRGEYDFVSYRHINVGSTHVSPRADQVAVDFIYNIA